MKKSNSPASTGPAGSIFEGQVQGKIMKKI
jgi:hypothetical protein